eukprot:1368962-Pyramimonas_sp.AAC.1
MLKAPAETSLVSASPPEKPKKTEKKLERTPSEAQKEKVEVIKREEERLVAHRAKVGYTFVTPPPPPYG